MAGRSSSDRIPWYPGSGVKKLRKLATASVILLVASVPIATLAAETEGELDWTAWQHLPVFHDGRMMPLNTFARMAVEKVCGRANPKLSPPAIEEAGQLFPDGKPRRFQAAELLLSWLAEPERWEHVPFLIGGYEQLRTDVLSLPVKDDEGKRLKYVSPLQYVAGYQELRTHFGLVAEKRRKAARQGEELKPSGLDQKARQLYDAYTYYRLLTFNPKSPVDSQHRFMGQLSDLVHTWEKALSVWQDLEPKIKPEGTQGTEEDSPEDLISAGAFLGQLNEPLEGLRQGLRQLAQGGEVALEEAEPLIVEVRRATAKIAPLCAGARDRLFDEAASGKGESHREDTRAEVRTLAFLTADLDRLAHQAHLALYDNGYSLRLVPALNPAALESDRDPDDDIQPWANLQTTVMGSDDVLAGYPPEKVGQVRLAFADAAAAYVNRNDPSRPKKFAKAMERLSLAVRKLGESVEETREKLPIRKRDDELIAITAYPLSGATDAEVHYAQLDPFFWSWLVCAFSMACFGLAFGLVRKPMFWLGIALLVASQLFTVYGFGLRVYITGWAPVTNMFETIMFVALTGAFLGIWLALYPVLGPGLENAWRMNAAPMTFEATELSEEQVSLLDANRWTAAGLLLLLPRLLLAAAVFYLMTMVYYGAGEGYTAVSLLPSVNATSLVAVLNDATVWLVGLCVLLLCLLYVPRVVLALLLSIVWIPYALWKKGLSKSMEQATQRRLHAMTGAFLGFSFALLAYYAPVSGKNIGLLMPVLRDNFWLTLHVLTITAAYGAGFLAWLFGMISLGYYFFGRYREPDGKTKPGGPPGRLAPEACKSLAGFIYKSTQVAFLLLVAGTLTGALWADVSWGRFWGWDPKEVWALISLLVYAAILHGRYAGMFGNFGLAVGSVIGAASIVMAWYGVNNVLGSGLHSYGEGSGGLGPILTIVVVNLAFVVAASMRYLMETRVPAASSTGR